MKDMIFVFYLPILWEIQLGGVCVFIFFFFFFHFKIVLKQKGIKEIWQSKTLQTHFVFWGSLISFPSIFKKKKKNVQIWIP